MLIVYIIPTDTHKYLPMIQLPQLHSSKFIACKVSNIHLGTTSTPGDNLPKPRHSTTEILSDGRIIHSLHTKLLIFPHISDKSITAHIFPRLD